MRDKTLLDYWIILYKRKKDVAVIAALSIFTAIILTKKLTPVYETSASFYVPASSQSYSFLSSSSIDKISRDFKKPLPIESEHGLYLGLLKSRKIAELVHQKYPQKKLEKLLRFDVNFSLSNEFMLKVYSRDRDPILAADIANAYVECLNLLLRDSSVENVNQNIFLIQPKISETKKKLMEAEEALKSFEENNNIASINEEIRNLTSQRISFQDKFEVTVALEKENMEKIKSFTEQFKKEQLLYSERDFSLTNPIIEYLQKELSNISAQINALSVELRDSHPDVMKLKRQHQKIEDRLKIEIQQFIASQIKPKDTFYEQLRQNLVNLLIEKNGLEALKNGYLESTNRITERLKLFPGIKTEWNRLNEEAGRLKKNYEQLKLNLQEAEIQQSRQMQFLVMVDRATPPQRPSFPVMWINITVALISSLLVGVFYAFLLDYIKETRKIRTIKLIKAVLSEE
jgi:uncharacterized protein involved in exopolysaccharide biosynthesis